MTEAWQARSFQQQEFVRALAGEVRDRADEAPGHEAYTTEFMIAILRYVAAAHDCELGVVPTEAGRQFAEMVARIEQFCRVVSERAYIAHFLFRELEPTAGSWAQRDYIRDQTERPQDVFGAPSAMTEVEDD